MGRKVGQGAERARGSMGKECIGKGVGKWTKHMDKTCRGLREGRVFERAWMQMEPLNKNPALQDFKRSKWNYVG